MRPHRAERFWFHSVLADTPGCMRYASISYCVECQSAPATPRHAQSSYFGNRLMRRWQAKVRLTTFSSSSRVAASARDAPKELKMRSSLSFRWCWESSVWTTHRGTADAMLAAPASSSKRRPDTNEDLTLASCCEGRGSSSAAALSILTCRRTRSWPRPGLDCAKRDPPTWQCQEDRQGFDMLQQRTLSI